MVNEKVPTFRTFQFDVLALDDADMELMTLISLAVKQFPDADLKAMAAWFAQKWGKGE